MKIRNINNYLKIIKLLSIILSLPIKVYGNENKTIHILTKVPDIPLTLGEAWQYEYESKINTYFSEMKKNNSDLQDYNLSFLFYNYVTSSAYSNGAFLLYSIDIMEGWVNGDYDLMIFDDRFLFSEMSFMESDWVEYYLNCRKPSIELLTDITDYVKDKDLSYHDPKILSNGKYDDRIYGLPYEIDFNLLYYSDENLKAKEIAETLPNNTWDDVLQKMDLLEDSLQIALGDDMALLDFFAEYTNTYYNTTKEYDPKYYKLFYNETGEDLFISFRHFLSTITGVNEKRVEKLVDKEKIYNYLFQIIGNSVFLSLDDAYSDFMKNKSIFYRGKASNYPIFRLNNNNNNTINNNTIDNNTIDNNDNDDNTINNNDNDDNTIDDNDNDDNIIDNNDNNNNTINNNDNDDNTIDNNDNDDNYSDIKMVLPPKGITSITGKYLVVNKNSIKDKKILAEIAYLLTSKEMQIFKGNHFGSIPTFDIKDKKNKDLDISSYCQSHTNICTIIEKMKPFYLKEMYVSKLSSPLYEIFAVLPSLMRKYYLFQDDLNYIQFLFQNIHELITEQLGIYKVIGYIITSVLSIIIFVMIYFVYYYRDNPYLRVISPKFINLIVLGCNMNMIKILQYLPPYTTFKAKFFFMYNTLCIGLIYIPMLAVTYRIYMIYETKSFNTGFLSDRALFIIIFVFICIPLIYNLFVCIFVEFFYMPFGSLKSPRFPEVLYENYELLKGIYDGYFYIIVSFIYIIYILIYII